MLILTISPSVSDTALYSWAHFSPRGPDTATGVTESAHALPVVTGKHGPCKRNQSAGDTAGAQGSGDAPGTDRAPVAKQTWFLPSPCTQKQLVWVFCHCLFLCLFCKEDIADIDGTFHVGQCSKGSGTGRGHASHGASM